MLELKNVSVVQGDFQLSANLSIESGRKTAIIGPSGSGKSTLLLAIAGFVPVHSGRIIWDGQDISRDRPGHRPISMVFQDHNLFPHMAVAENVGIGLHPDLRLNANDHALVSEAIERVGLKGYESQKPGSLSGGQIARVALARVVVQKNPLLLLDEPFAALGPALKAEMLDLVSEVVSESGATLLMVSHDPEDAKRITDSAVLVADNVANEVVSLDKFFAQMPKALSDYLGE